jgi:hypothetical protein
MVRLLRMRHSAAHVGPCAKCRGPGCQPGARLLVRSGSTGRLGGPPMKVARAHCDYLPRPFIDLSPRRIRTSVATVSARA